MGIVAILKIGNREVKSTDVVYEDLIILYEQYIKTYGEVPTMTNCDLKHNMPQRRIINRVLKEADVTYNDFLLKFGKISHVRTESKDFDLYVQRYKEVSNNLGRYLTGVDLSNNPYGLPNVDWFVKNCPDKNVKTFSDFVEWCGYDRIKPFTKEQVANKLKELESELKRPITRNDIKTESVGFSMIVINRLFGGLGKAKKEIGLLKTLRTPSKPFDYYKQKLDTTLKIIYEKTGRKIISWSDIENQIYNLENNHCEHKGLTKAFKREGLNIFAYIKSQGFEMTQNDFSYKYTFGDGEKVVSTMEFDFSTYLRELGFIYNKNYFRDVMYKTFCATTGKINCDYVLDINGYKIYIEIAGIISSSFKDIDWREANFPYKRQQDYQAKMIRKEKILKNAGVNYLFIYNDEMHNGKYKDLLNDKLKEVSKWQSEVSA